MACGICISSSEWSRPVERAWASQYVKAMRKDGARYGFGFIDKKSLHAPQLAEKAARYVSKYLAKWREDGSSRSAKA